MTHADIITTTGRLIAAASLLGDYDRLYHRLVRFARRFADRDTAEDAAQEVLVAWWEARARRQPAWTRNGEPVVVPDPSERDPYLFRAVRNRLRDERRLSRRLVSGIGGQLREVSAAVRAWRESDPSLTEPDVTRDVRDVIEELLRRLPPRCRETYIMLREQQMTYHDAALVLGVGIRTVRSHELRAHRVLRDGLRAAGYGVGTSHGGEGGTDA